MKEQILTAKPPVSSGQSTKTESQTKSKPKTRNTVRDGRGKIDLEVKV